MMRENYYRKCPNLHGKICLLDPNLFVTYQDRKRRLRYLDIKAGGQTERRVVTFCRMSESKLYQNACSGNPHSAKAMFVGKTLKSHG